MTLRVISRLLRRPLLGLAWVTLATACTTMDNTPVPLLKDGEIPVPADYKTWPKFLSAVQRPDAKQVREIYMNPLSRSATAATGFPLGTVFVMESYSARTKADGTLETGPDGKLVKGDLFRVSVMGKNKGWGEDESAQPRNGNWIYAGYLPNGQKGPEPTTACRACHLPLVDKDFVHRYDEYFKQ